jgi:Lrp/AsnC family transcriptional regulator, leucine-responsive regulatory protein
MNEFVVDIDNADLRILEQLQADGRLPVAALAQEVGLSATPCSLRLRKLERDHVILGYHARLNPRALQQALLVFVSVKLKATDEATLARFNSAVKPVKQILECHMTGGGFDYLLKIRVRDMAEFREILGSTIGTLPMIEATHSYFVMEEVKDPPLLNLPAIVRLSK